MITSLWRAASSAKKTLEAPRCRWCYAFIDIIFAPNLTDFHWSKDNSALDLFLHFLQTGSKDVSLECKRQMASSRLPGVKERERERGSWSLKGSDQDLKADNVGSCPGSCLYHPTDSFMKSCYLILRKSWGVYYGVESDNGGDGDIDGGSDVSDLYGRICG